MAPNKSVVHEVMLRLIAVIKEKDIPFIQLVGDQPVYTLTVQLRNENRAAFEKLLPVLGPFHTHCSFITAINKRFSGSVLSDLIVSADIVAEKSIDQALMGKHYRRAIRALQLTYEALQRRLIQAGKRAGHVLSDSLLVLGFLNSCSTFEARDILALASYSWQCSLNYPQCNVSR